MNNKTIPNDSVLNSTVLNRPVSANSVATNPILNNHSALGKGNLNFIESMLAQPHLITEQRQHIRSGDIPLLYEKLREVVSPWPVILGSKYKHEMRTITNKIGTLLHKSMVIMATDYPALFQQQYDLPLEWFTSQDQDQPQPAGPFMMGRYDALISRGAVKLVEYNAGTNLGGWHLYSLAERYRSVVDKATAANPISQMSHTPILEVFLAAFERMIKHNVAHFPDTKTNSDAGPFNLLFILENDNDKNEFMSSLPYFEKAINQRKLGLNLLFDVEFKNIDITDNGAWFNGLPIHGLSVPSAEIDATSATIQQLMHLHWQHKIVFPDNPINTASGNKSAFANLHFLMQRSKLSKDDDQLINKYIPWTHHLSKEFNTLAGQTALLDSSKLIANKDEYVIKRDGFLGGDHVYVGKFTGADTWASVVALAQNMQGWVAQKYYPSDSFYAPTDDNQIVPHDYIIGFFDASSEYGGAGVRLMPSKLNDGVVNSAKGANYTMVFEQAQQMLQL